MVLQIPTLVACLIGRIQICLNHRKTLSGHTATEEAGRAVTVPRPVAGQHTVSIPVCYGRVRLDPLAGVVPVAVAPTFSPPAGQYGGTQTVTLASITPGAVFRSTVDGTLPNDSSSAANPVTAPIPTLIRAYTKATGYSDSDVASALYSAPAATFTVYWGHTPNRVLTGSDVQALAHSAVVSNTHRDHVWGAGSTINDYFAFWMPTTGQAPTTNIGFFDVIGGFNRYPWQMTPRGTWAAL